MNRLFGTDGIRGVANADLTPELALRIGSLAAHFLTDEKERRKPIVVGRDTRISGPMLEAALIAGVTSAGRDAVSIGVVPTPAVACVTRMTGAAAGVMISASHNPIGDNGIKFFAGDGFKLNDAIEDRIEAALDSFEVPRATGTNVGNVRLSQNLARHYYHELSGGAARLDGLRVIVDAGFGAAYAIAPYVLRKLGADVSEIHCEADGARINVASGATDPRPLQDAVRLSAQRQRPAIGVAFDGDADRALFVDETGAVVTGDHVLFALGREMQRHGELVDDSLVATVMSNIGLERALRAYGIKLIRAAVGDRYVLEKMQSCGFVLGGEQSGHVIDFRHNTTGDGPRTAVTLLGIVATQATTLHELVREVVYAPQLLLNIRSNRPDVLNAPAVRTAIVQGEAALGETGRLLVRPSGTEPLIRVMAEGEDRGLIERVAREVVRQIEQEVERFVST